MPGVAASNPEPRFRWLRLLLAAVAIGGAVLFALQASTPRKPAARAAQRSTENIREPSAPALEARGAVALEQERAVERGAGEPAAAPGPGTTESVPSLVPDGELAAMAARRFSSPDEERSVWSERLLGERLTLQHQKAAAERTERVLENGASQGGVELTELARRQALLKAKIDAQSLRVAWLEKRVQVLAQN
jgi:hypothetical protein